MLKPEIVQRLNDSLAPERVHVRNQGGTQIKYLEGYDIIDTANSIFGYDGWQYDTVSVEIKEILGVPVAEAKVKVAIRNEEGEWVWRGDVGVCSVAAGKNSGSYAPSSIEMAIKGAVTDGIKRCFRTFGNQFGNSLYDKDAPPLSAPQPQINANAQNMQPFTPVTNASNAQPQQQGGVKTIPCQECGGVRTHKTGVNKSGKPYSGWFCSNGCKPIWDNIE